MDSSWSRLPRTIRLASGAVAVLGEHAHQPDVELRLAHYQGSDMDDVEYLVALQEAIAALPPDQRQQVLSSVGKDVATNGKRETLSFDEEVLWDALNKVSMSSQTPFEFRASYGVKRWKARLAFLHRFLAEERAALNQPQFAGLVLVCLRCLADWLQQLPKAPPIVARVLLNNFDYLPAAVDIGFPGYKNAGRLAKVAQLMLPGERR